MLYSCAQINGKIKITIAQDKNKHKYKQTKASKFICNFPADIFDWLFLFLIFSRNFLILQTTDKGSILAAPPTTRPADTNLLD